MLGPDTNHLQAATEGPPADGSTDIPDTQPGMASREMAKTPQIKMESGISTADEQHLQDEVRVYLVRRLPSPHQAPPNEPTTHRLLNGEYASSTVFGTMEYKSFSE